MIITDNSIIESVKYKYPELTKKGAEDEVKAAFYNMKEAKNKLAKIRMEIINLEKEVRDKESHFRNISEFFDITFGKQEIEEIKNNIEMGIINPTDYRNVNI